MRHARHSGINYNPFALEMGIGPKNPRPPYSMSPYAMPRYPMDYAMRGIYDTSMIATYGLVTAGTIGVLGSLIHR